MAAMCPPIHSKKLFNKGLAVEWSEIGFLFSSANEAGWDAKFLLNGHGHAALPAPVEFGEYGSGKTDGFVEFRRLHERVRSRGGIKNDPLFLGGIGIVLAECASDLGEFLHQIAFRVEATCRIANQEFDIPTVGAIPSIVAKSRRVALILTFQYLDAKSIAPAAELLDGCRSEGVRRDEEAGMVVGFQPIGQLRCRCRFAGSVHSDNEEGIWFACQWGCSGRGWGQDFEDFLASHLKRGFTRDIPPAVAEGLQNATRHRDTQIGPNQQFLEFIPVDRRSGEFGEETFKKSRSHILFGGF